MEIKSPHLFENVRTRLGDDDLPFPEIIRAPGQDTMKDYKDAVAKVCSSPANDKIVKICTQGNNEKKTISLRLRNYSQVLLKNFNKLDKSRARQDFLEKLNSNPASLDLNGTSKDDIYSAAIEQAQKEKEYYSAYSTKFTNLLIDAYSLPRSEEGIKMWLNGTYLVEEFKINQRIDKE